MLAGGLGLGVRPSEALFQPVSLPDGNLLLQIGALCDLLGAGRVPRPELLQLAAAGRLLLRRGHCQHNRAVCRSGSRGPTPKAPQGGNTILLLLEGLFTAALLLQSSSNAERSHGGDNQTSRRVQPPLQLWWCCPCCVRSSAGTCMRPPNKPIPPFILLSAFVDCSGLLAALVLCGVLLSSCPTLLSVSSAASSRLKRS